MIKRIALLAILVLLPVALFLLWPKVRDQFTTAAVTVSAVRQPRDEVLVSGFIKGFGAAPFSIQTLTIEEPGKEAYRRLVSLDAENKFELTLGKPVQGTYRASLLLGNEESAAAKSEASLATPPLRVKEGQPSPNWAVAAIQYDRPRLLAAAGACAAVWVVLLIACVRAWITAAGPPAQSPEQISRG